MAAEITPLKNRLIISGEISSWDVERFARHLYVYRPEIIELNSAGGDVAAAIRIATLIKGARVRVEVTGHGGLCASSCFFLFLASEDRLAQISKENGQLSDKWQSRVVGPVGIHRPYIQSSKQSSGNQMVQQEQVMRETTVYLKEQGVPQHLIDEMLSRPSNDIYWLTEKDLNAIGPYSPGYEEALISKCGFIRNSRLIDENWSDSRIRAYLEKFFACKDRLWSSEIRPLSVQFYSRLQTGWRPWERK